jgi:hypothetical protein
MSARTPNWETALYGTMHPLQVALLEAFAWVNRPLSPTLVVQLFDREYALNNIAYHVRRLADAGVIHQVDSIPRRGATEHLYRLVD